LLFSSFLSFFLNAYEARYQMVPQSCVNRNVDSIHPVNKLVGMESLTTSHIYIIKNLGYSMSLIQNQ
jgi:hypothetical protein